MGWTSLNKPSYIKTVDFLKKDWDNNENYEIIETAMCGYTSVFFAVRNKELGYVFAVAYMIQFSKGYYNLSYKSMDEFCGPNILGPKKILKLLTPIAEIAKLDGEEFIEDSEKSNGYQWANNWRKRSAAKFEKKSIKSGDIFITDEVLNFQSGHSFDTFEKRGKYLFAIEFQKGRIVRRSQVKFNPKRFECKVLTEQEIGERMR